MTETGQHARHPSIQRGVLLLTFALASLPVAAHKLQVFAFAEGDRIEGTAYFAGGAKATGARILIRDAEGRTLAQLTPAHDGSFSYRARTPIDHLIVAESGDGHRAEWRITAPELAGGFPTADATGSTHVTSPVNLTPTEMNSAQSTESPTPPAIGVDPALIAAIDRAVARQVRPLREQLITVQDEIRLRDILGGLGYILGLTGFALWWQSRGTKPRRPE